MLFNEKDIVETLKYYQDESLNPENHNVLLKDKKVILLPATLLEDENSNIVQLSLNIFENFVNNPETYDVLLSTFGVFEALQSLSMRTRKSDPTTSKRAKYLAETLQNCTGPAFRTRSRKNYCKNHQNWPQVYVLQIRGLKNLEISDNLRECLLKIKGIVSFILDVDMERCTLRITNKITIKLVIDVIYKTLHINALVITKAKEDKTEVVRDIKKGDVNISNLEYFSDEESSKPKPEKAISTKNQIVENGNNILKSISNYLAESFYW